MTIKSRAFLLLCAVGAMGIGALTARSPSSEARSGTQEPKREKPVDRTTPRLQRMAPAQREHARLHAEHGKTRFGNTRLLDEKLSKFVHSDYGPPTNLEPIREVVTSTACRVDTVFIGHVVKGESLPTEDGKMIFTDYSVLIGDVFRAPPEQPLGAAPVTVTRLGGAIDVDGTTVFAKLDRYPPLKIGHTYLFFVEFLPRFKTFYAKDSDAVWEVLNDRVRPLSSVLASDRNVMADGLDGADLAGWLRGASCR